MTLALGWLSQTFLEPLLRTQHINRSQALAPSQRAPLTRFWPLGLNSLAGGELLSSLTGGEVEARAEGKLFTPEN